MEKINFGQVNESQPQNNGRGKVVVSLNPVKQRVFIDIDGNEYDSINPRTRKLIRRANE
jgi:hypothetical protein